MKSILKKLQLFADGSDGGAAAMDGTGETAEAVAEEGQVAADTTAEEGQVAADNPEESFEDLIKGKFKKDYDERVSEAIKDRIKNIKKSEETLEKYSIAHKLLAKHYGINEDDAEALSKAIQDDDAFYENEAMASGMDTVTFKTVEQTRLENEQLKAYKESIERKAEADKIINRWNEQAQTAKQMYPSLDLQAEMQNDDFKNLLKAGVDVKAAFEVIHKDEIMAGFGQHVAKTVEQKVINKVKSGAARPQENGVSGNGGALAKTSVENLTDKQIMELINRSARGERIEL